LHRSDLIYLNKRDSINTSEWAYYRLSSGGNVGDPIELCLLSWPTFVDIDDVLSVDKAVVINPGDTGFESAYPNNIQVLKNKWGIDHEKSTLIGVIVKQ